MERVILEKKNEEEFRDDVANFSIKLTLAMLLAISLSPLYIAMLETLSFIEMIGFTTIVFGFAFLVFVFSTLIAYIVVEKYKKIEEVKNDTSSNDNKESESESKEGRKETGKESNSKKK